MFFDFFTKYKNEVKEEKDPFADMDISNIKKLDLIQEEKEKKSFFHKLFHGEGTMKEDDEDKLGMFEDYLGYGDETKPLYDTWGDELSGGWGRGDW